MTIFGSLVYTRCDTTSYKTENYKKRTRNNILCKSWHHHQTDVVHISPLETVCITKLKQIKQFCTCSKFQENILPMRMKMQATHNLFCPNRWTPSLNIKTVQNTETDFSTWTFAETKHEKACAAVNPCVYTVPNFVLSVSLHPSQISTI